MLNMMQAIHARAVLAHTALYVAGASSLEVWSALDAALHYLVCLDAEMSIWVALDVYAP